MSWLGNLFGKHGKESDQDTLNVTTAAGIETMLRTHLKRLDAYQGRPGAKELRHLSNQLLEGDRWSFAVESIRQSISDSLSKNGFSHATKLFSDWYIAVTICPWLAATEVRTHLERGYPALLGELTNPAYAQPSGRHVAHWIYCTDGKQAGVHLTLVPNPKVVRAIAVIAEDLLTPNERREMGI